MDLAVCISYLLGDTKGDLFMRYEAYTDGSFKEVKGVGAYYASAAIIAAEGTSDWSSIVKVSNDKDLISMRNVAGELMAVMAVCEHCMNVLHLKQGDTLRINYDYVGIENWCKKPGEKDFWRAKNPITSAYRDYILTVVKPKFKLEFNHVTGHSGNVGNEIVDKLAREAIDKRFAEDLSK